MVLDRLVERVRRKVEDALPWFDREEAARKEAHSEELRLRAIANRLNAEAVRSAYLAYAGRLEKRK
jgi:hypothetical protein